MPFVQATKEEVANVKKAIKDHDWKQLNSNKERYMYQIFCKSPVHVQEIAEYARMKSKKQFDDTVQAAQEIFGGV